MNSKEKQKTYQFLLQDSNIELKNRYFLSIIGTLSLLWLLISGLFSLVESIKLHAPSIFSNHVSMSYGRIHHIAQLSFFGALLHGFLWIGFSHIVNRAQYLLKFKNYLIISYLFLNSSIIIGIIEIISGNLKNGTLIFPSCSLFLFSFSLFFLIPVIWRSLFERKQLSPSVLFASLAFWIIPFSLITMLFISSSGFLHAAYGSWILSWFSHHLFSLFLIPLGLSTLLEYAQRITKKEFQNPYPLYFAFWIYTTANLLTTSELTQGTHSFLPAWLRSINTVGALFSSFSILILLHSLYSHLKPTLSTLKKRLSFGFFSFASFSIALLTGIKTILAFQEIEKWVQFTSVIPALQTLLSFGFLLMILFAWIYEEAPEILQGAWVSPSLIQTHLWLTSLATGFTTLALLIAGGIQIYRHSNAEISFLSTSLLIRPLLWVQSLSLVFQFSGFLMIALLFLLLLLQWKPNPKNSMFINPSS